ncbi:DUF7009 family protein [Terriglobus roseus]|uniref:Uncharacterized protein n=1 Tax=Terriglobus roseus TaxID=392734 RepID=A0A1G7JFW3_9BACT|nr:hypothetical protein [Terriglobus roseus]SDF23379.1 hypothetical protein SAMN05444167_1795 [Terriglobus roseus]
MKLRIKDNSIRFRLLRTEVAKLADEGEISAFTSFALGSSSDRFCYSIKHRPSYEAISANLRGASIRVSVPSETIRSWAANDAAVGLYAEQVLFGGERLHISIEKDFACIDRDDENNADTFDNPNATLC